MKQPSMKVVWVIYSLGSGAVHALYFRDPKSVKYGFGIVKTALSESAIQRPHHLRVVGEKVVSILSAERI